MWMANPWLCSSASAEAIVTVSPRAMLNIHLAPGSRRSKWAPAGRLPLAGLSLGLAIDTTVDKGRPVTIYFYSTRGDHGCFSNFSRHAFELDGKRWPTSEHYFQ